MQDKNLGNKWIPLFFACKSYTIVYYLFMNTPKTLLSQLSSFDQMERGTLSVLRQTTKGPCCNFQKWDGTSHRSEYIPADQVPFVEANIARYRDFQSVVDQYVDLVGEQSRQERLAGGKKKRSIQTSASPKKLKSKN